MADPKSGTLTLTITHPFLHDFESADGAIKVTPVEGSEEEPPYLDLSFKVETDDFVKGVLKFEQGKDDESGLLCHKMKTAGEPNPRLLMKKGRLLTQVENPAFYPALLFCLSGTLQWVGANDEDADEDILVTDSGFERITACENTCK